MVGRSITTVSCLATSTTRSTATRPTSQPRPAPSTNREAALMMRRGWVGPPMLGGRATRWVAGAVTLLSGALVLAIGLTTSPAAAEPLTAALRDELRHGGFVIVIRHGKSNQGPSFMREASPMDPANCSMQFVLDEAGREQARAIGAGFEKHGI